MHNPQDCGMVLIASQEPFLRGSDMITKFRATLVLFTNMAVSYVRNTVLVVLTVSCALVGRFTCVSLVGPSNGAMNRGMLDTHRHAKRVLKQDICIEMCAGAQTGKVASLFGARHRKMWA